MATKEVAAFMFLMLLAGTTAYAQDEKRGQVSETSNNKDKAETKDVKKKEGHLFTFDVPLMLKGATIHPARIISLNLHIGPVINPWEEELKYRYLPIPEFGYSSKNVDLGVRGGLFLAEDEGLDRKNKNLVMSSQGSVWYVLVGSQSFIQKETVSRMPAIFDFVTDFSRLSYGGQGFVGAKFGSFTGNFLAVKVGRGYVSATGVQRYRRPDLPELEELDLYDEEFLTNSVVAEGQLVFPRVGLRISTERNEYERVRNSPDPFRYGLNRFDDMKAQVELEITPIPVKKADMLRVVVRGTKTFDVNDGLLFLNDSPSLLVLIRIAVK